MKPERIQIAPELGGSDQDPELGWKATITVSRTIELEPSSEASFLSGVLQRAHSLPNPPRVTYVVEAAAGKRGGFATSVSLEWNDIGLMTEVEIDFAHWVSGLHDHLTIAPMAPN